MSKHSKHRTQTEAALAGILRGHSPRDIAALARSMTDVRVEAGTVLTREGTPGAQAFLVLDGRATATVAGHEVGRVAAGEFVGEMAMFDRARRSATVTADTDMHLMVMAPDEFAAVIADQAVSRRVARDLARRLAAADARTSS
jgi:CRP-like cAMP-binding protein